MFFQNHSGYCARTIFRSQGKHRGVESGGCCNNQGMMMVASSRGVNSEVITITIIKVFKLCVHILKVERTEFPGRVVPGK